MSIWNQVRRRAWIERAALIPPGTGLIAARDLFAAAERATGIQCHARPEGDALLAGAEALYDPDNQRIYYCSTDPSLVAFHIAHEFAHHWLDRYASHCTHEDLDLAAPAEPQMSWVGDPDAYSPKERAEALANVFAREFLLPRRVLRDHCKTPRFDASRIASDIGVPIEMVMQQLADALLLPPESESVEEPLKEEAPDDSQRQAIEAGPGALRVLAGPGTGKTRTLVGRVAHLIGVGEDARSIAVLTFSNLSAQDLALRLHGAIGERATGLWSGTFHAFGLELMRKYGHEIGLLAVPRLLDRSGSLNLLLELLPSLNLKYYLDLNEPVRGLRAVAHLISRAKDELASPLDYERAAIAYKASATDEAARESAEKSLEVAGAYAEYERQMRERGWVDFGDLIARSVELLTAHPQITSQVRATYRHVLVDEYQDMNRASGILLKCLVEPGTGPWVVGDVRQAIYRFRGASPLNLELFTDDFPDARTVLLDVNYRSYGRIIRTFEAFGGGNPLKAHRGEHLGSVELHVASSSRAEYEGISKSIRSSISEGHRFGDHAVLARSHTTLARLSRHLEETGVPTLYFGDFFERPEIRDLLSVVQLTSEPTGVALVRVGQFPQYNMPQADIALLLRWAEQQDRPMLKLIQEEAEGASLSSTGRASLKRLAADLSEVSFTQSAHALLLTFLFRQGDYLTELLASATVSAQQRRLAIFQLLQFAFGFRAPPGFEPKRAFLGHIRRMELLDEEKQLRGLPAAAIGIDAVRLMTIHAAKGLQFPIVHIPTLTNRHFPMNRPELHSLPPALVNSSLLMSREAEEEALYFVALSRARDSLSLSRAINNGGGGYSNCKPSAFLGRIGTRLPANSGATTWVNEGPAIPPTDRLPPPPARAAWPAAAIETYLACPRKFYYGEVLALAPREGRSPFLQSRSALRATIDWMRESGVTKSGPNSEITERFSADWETKGPRGHALETLYRRAAESMLETALDLLSGGPSGLVDLAFTTQGGVTLTARADHVSHRNGRLVVHRLKEGRLAKNETSKLRYAIWQGALGQQSGGDVSFEHVSLLTGERRAENKAIASEIKKLEGALTGIAGGSFHPQPDQYCAQCPFYFICPSHFRFHEGSG
jgi:DNA helicase-2/ATP-dependent DNA helicase PcrA